MTDVLVESQARAPRRWFSALGAFSALTLCWITVGLVSGGDFLAQGKTVAFVLLGMGAVCAGVLGARIVGRMTRVVVVALAAGCLLFWVLAPDGWWALPPPTRNTVRVE